MYTTLRGRRDPSPMARSTLFFGCAIVCSILVFLTGFKIVYSSGESFDRTFNYALRIPFLGGENNVGAWWSGMLLLLLSLLAYDGHASYKTTSPRLAQAWAVIASILVFFSLDEIGSLHERLGTLGKKLHVGTWAFLLPLGAILGILLGRALLILWSTGGRHRRQVVPLSIGFGLLGSVAIQEFLETRLHWETAPAQAIRVMVEEGTELAGMLVLLWAVMDNTFPFCRRTVMDSRPTFAVLTEKWRPLVGIVLIVVPLAAWVTIAVDADGRGRPADWIAASLFSLMALLAVRPCLTHGAPLLWVGWLTVGLSLLASVAVLLLPVSSQRFGVEASPRLMLIGALCSLLGLIRLVGTARTASYGILVLAAAVAPFTTHVPWAVYLSVQALALGSFASMARELEEEPTRRRAREPDSSTAAR